MYYIYIYIYNRAGSLGKQGGVQGDVPGPRQPELRLTVKNMSSK